MLADLPVAEAVGSENLAPSSNSMATAHSVSKSAENTEATDELVVEGSSYARAATFPTPAKQSQSQPGDLGVTKTWRHGLCDCFSTFFQPLFWMGCCCTPLVYGQVMTRMRLDWLGQPDRVHAGAKTFGIVSLLFIAYLSLSLVGICFVGLAFFIYSMVAFTRARSEVRRRFRIPAYILGCCNGGLEDCCCIFWCGCCSSIQMARHTHNEDKYPYEPCAPNGLPTYAPELMTMENNIVDDDTTLPVV